MYAHRLKVRNSVVLRKTRLEFGANLSTFKTKQVIRVMTAVATMCLHFFKTIMHFLKILYIKLIKCRIVLNEHNCSYCTVCSAGETRSNWAESRFTECSCSTFWEQQVLKCILTNEQHVLLFRATASWVRGRSKMIICQWENASHRFVSAGFILH